MQHMALSSETRVRLWDDCEITLGRLALSMGRIIRFAGNTKANVPTYSVLHHTMSGVELLGLEKRQTKHDHTVCYWMLHDATDPEFGDVNGRHKPDSLRQDEERSRSMIYESLGIPEPSPTIWNRVEKIDKRIKNAEAAVVVEPVNTRVIPEMAWHSDDKAREAVENVWRAYPVVSQSMTPDGALIREFIEGLDWAVAGVRG